MKSKNIIGLCTLLHGCNLPTQVNGAIPAVEIQIEKESAPIEEPSPTLSCFQRQQLEEKAETLLQKIQQQFLYHF